MRHKISQTKYTVSRSFHLQFLCHIVRLHMFHKTTILINMHCQKSVTNIMNNFEIALKFNPRAEKYTESTLGCFRRSACLTCIALPSFPNSPRPFLPSSLSKTLRRLWEVIYSSIWRGMWRMLLPKQVVQIVNICQWAVTTWTKSRGSFYVNIRVKLARYVCNSESKWKIRDEAENTICSCIKAYFLRPPLGRF